MRRSSRITILCSFLLWLNSSPMFAVNWLMLQGTEHPFSPAHQFIGFIQGGISIDTSESLSGLAGTPSMPGFSENNGQRIATTTISPQFDDDRALHIRRARFGARGVFSGVLRNSFTAKMNYFSLVEVASNLMTYDPFGGRARAIALDHFSITFNHIPGARIRTGLFKTPGAEEALQGVHTLDYIELTDFTAREIVERFVSGAQKPAGSPGSPSLGVATNTSYGINAVRDWGVQVFDSFKREKWDVSYATMLGRGEAIQEKNIANDNIEIYLYLSAEYDFPGGYGVMKNGLKLYGWYQNGEREFTTDPARKKYERTRFGFGSKLLGRFFGSQYKYRLGAELMFAEGMIFIAPAGGVANGFVNDGNLQIAAQSGNKSRAATIDFGFFPTNKWQLDLRFHQHDLLYQTAETVNPGNERVLTEITLGLNYHISRKLRLTVNYVFRNLQSPVAYASGAQFVPANTAENLSDNVRTIVDTVDDRVLFQVTWVL